VLSLLPSYERKRVGEVFETHFSILKKLESIALNSWQTSQMGILTELWPDQAQREDNTRRLADPFDLLANMSLLGSISEDTRLDFADLLVDYTKQFLFSYTYDFLKTLHESQRSIVIALLKRCDNEIALVAALTELYSSSLYLHEDQKKQLQWILAQYHHKEKMSDTFVEYLEHLEKK
jgi:hypothetical protein